MHSLLRALMLAMMFVVAPAALVVPFIVLSLAAMRSHTGTRLLTRLQLFSPTH